MRILLGFIMICLEIGGLILGAVHRG